MISEERGLTEFLGNISDLGFVNFQKAELSKAKEQEVLVEL